MVEVVAVVEVPNWGRPAKAGRGRMFRYSYLEEEEEEVSWIEGDVSVETRERKDETLMPL